ncbi:NAD(P)H-quinone oxidoreductase [Acaricomes phytoseiuli]|uniref:NAD(P)H-quinone oxidoreductase n=1 Tax=Acaricomes phytoseiuli TaxID=291968 RepID=UPI000381496C|nr:NAD(P)H-quinone oxidoreductase [Acaricomes phytoseiuli]
MKAIEIESPGGPESLVLQDVPEPAPGPGEVLIQVTAAGVNRADVQQRRGLYPPPPGAPDYPGLEVSGHIIGDGEGFRDGDPVVALLAGGGYAERVAVPAGQVIPAPEGLDLQAAAGLPETAATVYSNLVLAAGLQAGQTLLVHGGSGGIGAMAIQFATALGARVVATAGRAEKCQTVLRLGASVAVNYRDEDFVAVLQELGGADVILDVIGAGYLARNLEALATGGKLVVIGLQGGAKAELNLAVLMAKRAAIIGTTLRARPAAEKAEVMRQVQEQIWPLVADERIDPVIDKVFPLAEAHAAHEYFDSGKHHGKILLTP